MAGVQVIWFSVPVTCIYANVTTLQHFTQHLLPTCTLFLYTSKECACGTLQINRQIKSNWLTKVWRLCKWFTFHCYVVIFCIVTTVRQFSTTTGPHWNVIYTLIKTAGVVHYRSAVRSRKLSSVTEWQACILSDFQCRLHAVSYTHLTLPTIYSV